MQFVAFRLVADVVSRLEVGPVPGCFFCAVITVFAPSAYWTNFVNHEAERMLRVAGLVVVDRTEPAVADPAGGGHLTEAGPVFPAGVSVGGSWIGFTHSKTKARTLVSAFADQSGHGLKRHRPRFISTVSVL